jgi:dTDP-4-dehydrorhamnose 3,5-epimerase
MNIEKSNLFSDVRIFTPNVYRDNRGFFLESYNNAIDEELNVKFYQDNQSMSSKYVLRGLHYQWDEPMGKLVRVVVGSVLDVIVDLRKDSSTYGMYEKYFLSGDNFKQLWVPPGFGHAILSLEDNTQFVYKCSSLHNSSCEGCIYPFDESINIDWGVDKEDILLSEKDKNANNFEHYKNNPKF